MEISGFNGRLCWLCCSQDALLERPQTWSAQHILICCVCLGDNSEDADEIIQCDNCGVTVHEGKTQLAAARLAASQPSAFEGRETWAGSFLTIHTISSSCSFGLPLVHTHTTDGALLSAVRCSFARTVDDTCRDCADCGIK